MKRYIKLYFAYLANAIKSKLAYRADAIIGIFSFFAINFASFATLYLTISNIPSLNGWTFEQMAFLYGFCLLPKSIDHVFTDNIWMISNGYIIKGQLDKYLIKPINPLFQIISEHLQYEGLGETILGLFLIIYYGPKQGIIWNANNIIPLIICLIASIFLFTSIKLIFSSLAFWTGRSIRLLTGIYDLSNFTKYPITIFNDVVKVLLTYIIPFSLFMFVPINYIYSNKPIWLLSLLLVNVVLILLIIGYLIWRAGLKRYESAGS